MADVAETIEDSGRRIGHHAWIEARLFEIVGRWVGTVTEPRSRALFGRQSAHHAWHAELWHGLLPALPHVSDSQLVASDEAHAELVETLSTLDDVDAGEATAGAVSRLVVLRHQVLPQLLAAYDDHLAHTTPITDAPTVRVLRLVRADLAADMAAGDALLAALEETSTPPA